MNRYTYPSFKRLRVATGQRWRNKNGRSVIVIYAPGDYEFSWLVVYEGGGGEWPIDELALFNQYVMVS